MSTNLDRSLYRHRTVKQATPNVAWRRHQEVVNPPSALDKATELGWIGLGILEGMFAIRFALKLMGANPENPFATLVYGFTDLFLRPFNGLVATPEAGGMILEISTLVAMAVYALAFWVVLRVLVVVFDRPEVTDDTYEVSVQDSSSVPTVTETHVTTTTDPIRKDY
jgi:hypothetical protein